MYEACCRKCQQTFSCLLSEKNKNILKFRTGVVGRGGQYGGKVDEKNGFGIPNDNDILTVMFNIDIG